MLAEKRTWSPQLRAVFSRINTMMSLRGCSATGNSIHRPTFVGPLSCGIVLCYHSASLQLYLAKLCGRA